MIPSVQIPNEKKHQLKEILEKHDLAAFRAFCIEDAKLEQVARYPEEKLSRLMYTLKARQLHFGALSQEARNHLRLEKLKSFPERWSQDLKDHAYCHDEYPLCHGCEWFRKAPQLDTHACMHLGATPLDVACPGWTKDKQETV